MKTVTNIEPTNRHRIINAAAILLCIFNVLVPKGGLQGGGVPLTWGYMLIALFTLFALPGAILTSATQPVSTWSIFAASIPFQATLLYATAMYKITLPGYAVSQATSFGLLPIVFLLCFGRYWSICDQKLVYRTLAACIFGAAVYGIFLFFWRIKMGYFIEIPYVTVNASDIGLTGTIKENGRGSIYKLISSYANGNIYGVTTLMLLPLYDEIEKPRRWRSILVRLALALTLSRTVWLCLILSQIIKPVVEALQRFPKLTFSWRLLFQMFLVVPVSGLVVVALWAMNADLSFLFDPTLGGRAPQLEALRDLSFLPTQAPGGISEIVYLGILSDFGVLGLLTFMLMLFSPLIFAIVRPHVWRNKYARAALAGQLIYAAAAGMDGAINYIPVMAVWWFLTMIIIRTVDKKERASDGNLLVSTSPTASIANTQSAMV